jgi:hypothetical protein
MITIGTRRYLLSIANLQYLLYVVKCLLPMDFCKYFPNKPLKYACGKDNREFCNRILKIEYGDSLIMERSHTRFQP